MNNKKKTRANYFNQKKANHPCGCCPQSEREPAASLLSLFSLDLIINCLLACGGGIKEEGEGGEIAAPTQNTLGVALPGHT